MNYFNKIYKALRLIVAIPLAIAVFICYIWFVFKSIPVVFHFNVFSGVLCIITYILLTPLVVKCLYLVVNPTALSDNVSEK